MIVTKEAPDSDQIVTITDRLGELHELATWIIIIILNNINGKLSNRGHIKECILRVRGPSEDTQEPGPERCVDAECDCDRGPSQQLINPNTPFTTLSRSQIRGVQ